MTWLAAQKALRRHATSARAVGSARFFKTGPGEYGEGDLFIGVTVPQVRLVAKEFRALPLPELKKGMRSPIHEDRLLALVVLVMQFDKADPAQRKRIFDFYFENVKGINNWDLVDVSAPQIVGRYLEDKNRSLLHRLSRSKNLWEKRIAIVATFHFIRQSDFADCLEISERLIPDPHDLLAKACGWMLREVGKKDRKTLEGFLDKHHRRMPRVMLRYSLERLPPRTRQAYMTGKP